MLFLHNFMKCEQPHGSRSRNIGYIIIGIFSFLFIFGVARSLLRGEPTDENKFTEVGDCNTALVTLHGVLDTYAFFDNVEQIDVIGSEDIIKDIETAAADRNIKAIVLDIDSPGGAIVAGEEVANALKFSAKPTVAVIRGQGLSAAYYAASGADVIFSSMHSYVGNVGVTMSYVDNVEKNEKEGLSYNSLSIGRFKDVGDPNRTLAPVEREMLLSQGSILYKNLLKEIAENRKLDYDVFSNLADGRIFIGTEAEVNGLVDKIGDLRNVKQYLVKKIGDVSVVCRPEDDIE